MSEMVEALRSTADLKGSLRYTFLLARRAVLRGAAVGMAWEATIAVIPLLAQRAIDEGIMPGNWRRLALWLALILVTGVLTAVFTAMRHRAATQAGALGSYGLQGRLMRHLLSLHAGFHDRADRGDVLVRFSADAATLGIFVDLIVTWAAHASSVLLIVIFMLTMDLQLGFIATACIPMILALVGLALHAYEGRATAQHEAAAGLTGILHETIAGVRAIKGLGAESHQRRRYTGQ